MKRGFEGLKPRKEDISSLEINEFEKEYDLVLPPLYRKFVTWFVVGSELFQTDKYYVDAYDDYYYCSYQKFPTQLDFELDKFLSLEDVFNHWNNKIGYGEEDYSNGYLKIATINRGGAIFVGTEGKELDKILVHVWDFDPSYFELASDIISFVRQIEITAVPEDDLIDGVVYSQLYRNWGENFWRVRKDQPA